jgi:hypothetical protein
MIIRYDINNSFSSWFFYSWNFNDGRGRQFGFRFLGIRVELGFVPEYLR